MPLYTFMCEDCKTEAELLLRHSDTPSCPSCGSGKMQRQVARISREIKYPAMAKAWRQAATKSGDLSNFSKAELSK